MRYHKGKSIGSYKDGEFILILLIRNNMYEFLPNLCVAPRYKSNVTLKFMYFDLNLTKQTTAVGNLFQPNFKILRLLNIISYT